MLTKDDINKLLKVFATKQELKEGLYLLKEEFSKKFDKVLTKLDAVYKEIKDVREEQTVHSTQHERIDEEIASVKERVTKLESSL